jgi:predicted transcriptional regulator
MQDLKMITDPKNLAQELRRIFSLYSKNQLDIAESTGVHQSQVSRILRGAFKLTTSHNVIRLCEYAEKCATQKEPPRRVRDSEAIMNALEDVWNGSHKQELLLAAVIRCVGKKMDDDHLAP